MGAKMTLTKTEMIVRDLDKDILNNPNHITRRLFTVYLDGSYGQGEGWYEKTKEFIATHKDNKKKMRQFVIQEFSNYTAIDNSTSLTHTKRAITNHFTKSELEILNDGLISDAIGHFDLQ